MSGPSARKVKVLREMLKLHRTFFPSLRGGATERCLQEMIRDYEASNGS